MSRRDTYHYVVTDALIREGWTITHDPYTFDIVFSHSNLCISRHLQPASWTCGH